MPANEGFGARRVTDGHESDGFDAEDAAAKREEEKQERRRSKQEAEDKRKREEKLQKERREEREELAAKAKKEEQELRDEKVRRAAKAASEDRQRRQEKEIADEKEEKRRRETKQIRKDREDRDARMAREGRERTEDLEAMEDKARREKKARAEAEAERIEREAKQKLLHDESEQEKTVRALRDTDSETRRRQLEFEKFQNLKGADASRDDARQRRDASDRAIEMGGSETARIWHQANEGLDEFKIGSSVGLVSRVGQLTLGDGSGNDRNNYNRDARARNDSRNQFAQTRQIAAAPSQIDDFDPYDAMGLFQKDKPSPDKIKDEWKKQSKKHHPDRDGGKSQEKIERSRRRIMDVNRAYDILSDPDRKRAYDEERIVQDWQFKEWMNERKGGGSYRR